MSKTAQSFETLCEHRIEYPILCFVGPYPDGKEIKLINLADKQGVLNQLDLGQLRIICFVGNRSHAPDVSIVCFLAWDTQDNQVVHCMVHCENVFRKKINKEMNDFFI